MDSLAYILKPLVFLLLFIFFAPLFFLKIVLFPIHLYIRAGLVNKGKRVFILPGRREEYNKALENTIIKKLGDISYVQTTPKTFKEYIYSFILFNSKPNKYPTVVYYKDRRWLSLDEIQEGVRKYCKDNPTKLNNLVDNIRNGKIDIERRKKLF